MILFHIYPHFLSLSLPLFVCVYVQQNDNQDRFVFSRLLIFFFVYFNSDLWRKKNGFWESSEKKLSHLHTHNDRETYRRLVFFSFDGWHLSGYVCFFFTSFFSGSTIIFIFISWNVRNDGDDDVVWLVWWFSFWEKKNFFFHQKNHVLFNVLPMAKMDRL